MATYLQGVTDYIPEYQPFQPDFNFFASALQTKQNRYDKNWSKLNRVYGKFVNAPLTHSQSIANRDQYLKNAVKNIQKISGLDLSLEQNVQQAMQVFTPFYNDKNLKQSALCHSCWLHFPLDPKTYHTGSHCFGLRSMQL